MESATGKRKNEESQDLSKRPKTGLVPVSGLALVSGLAFDIGWDIIFEIFSHLLRIGSTFYVPVQHHLSVFGVCKSTHPSIPLVCKKAYEWYKGKEEVRLDYLLLEKRGRYQAYMACVQSFCFKGPFESFARGGYFGYPFSPDGRTGSLTLLRSKDPGSRTFSLIDGDGLMPAKMRAYLNRKEYLVFAASFLGERDGRESGTCGFTKKKGIGKEPFPDGHIFWSMVKPNGYNGSIYYCKGTLIKDWLSTVRGDANLNSQLRAIMKDLNKVIGFF